MDREPHVNLIADSPPEEPRVEVPLPAEPVTSDMGLIELEAGSTPNGDPSMGE